MSKTKFWILNLVGGACALLIACDLWLARANTREGQFLSARQSEIARAQQVQNTMRNLAFRIAHDAETDASLKDLLKRQELKVTFDNPTEARKTP